MKTSFLAAATAVAVIQLLTSAGIPAYGQVPSPVHVQVQPDRSLAVQQPAVVETARPALTVAVLPFDTTLVANKAKASEISTLLAVNLTATPDVWMVEREEIDRLLGEQSIGLSGLADPATVSRSGRIIGARVIVTGRYIPAGDSAVLVAKVISVETSRVFGETATCSNTASAAELDTAIRVLTDKVAAILANQKAVFDPMRDQSEKILAKLREAALGKKLPSISIQVTEKDLRQPATIDPALQTEMEIRLVTVGFKLAPKELAEVLVTGEAFSETGTRHGDLISARARGEIRATRAADKTVLAVDRETAAAVDTTASAAGKTALQNAGIALADRLALKLIPVP